MTFTINLRTELSEMTVNEAAVTLGISRGELHKRIKNIPAYDHWFWYSGEDRITCPLALMYLRFELLGLIVWEEVKEDFILLMKRAA